LVWPVLKAVVAALIGYLLGSANTSLIVGKFYGVDVRKHGSGNAGMTNTLRTLGKFPAFLVILGDTLKGILACVIGYYIFKIGFDSSELNFTVELDRAGLLPEDWEQYWDTTGLFISGLKAEKACSPLLP